MALAGALAFADITIEHDVEKALAVMSSDRKMDFIVWRGEGVVLGGCDGVRLFESRQDGFVSAALFDGHLDNRQEILRSMGLVSSQVSSDAQLLLLAWQRWREDCLTRWVGRFACMLWDGRTRQLMLGGDALGKRTLCYWQGKERCLFASEPRGLLVQAEVPKAFNQAYIAEMLASVPTEPGTTIFADVRKLPPGHLLLVQDGQFELHRYWQPENLPYLYLSRTEDYVEALRAELERAVACRLPATGLVGCYLSAGLDSSSIAVVAARQLAEQGRPLVAFTTVPRAGFAGKPNSRQIFDEGPLAALTATRYPNIEHVLVPNNTLPLFEAMDMLGIAADCPAPNASNVRWSMAIGEEVRKRGLSAMLTGNLGNMSLSYDGMMAPASLLRQGRLLDLLLILQGLRKEGFGWPGVAGSMVFPLFPAARKTYRRLKGEPELEIFDCSLINPELAHRTGVVERAKYRFHVNGEGRTLRLRYIQYFQGFFTAGFRRLFHAEYADPLLDRRLFELCLSIPEEQFIQRGEPRSLVRKVMADCLPSELLAERRRGIQSPHWYEGLNQARPQIVQELVLLEASPIANECLDLARMRKLVENWPEGDFDHPAIRPLYAQGLTRALSMARFLRRVESSPTYPLNP
jgi:asparagine synthase (glutamine-hydrolysing)